MDTSVHPQPEDQSAAGPDRMMDAVLHLLDRQVIDVDGFMVCKVDDLELTTHPDGRMVVSAILVGPAALLPRYAGRAGRGALRVWTLLGVTQRDRERPWRIPIGAVERTGNAVHLRVRRDGLLTRGELPPADRSSLADLLGADVQCRGSSVGKVMDVRLRTDRATSYECVALLTGRAVPGAFLGYERREAMGPAWLHAVVRWLMRHCRQIALEDTVQIDRSARRVQVDAEPGPVETI